ncbi:hypothetical protein BQ8794_140044 [Mesorhizobium prunaredense]|uniref:Uncharacterized protein n=1 Tax=Mesorhizobium prunaredense TaxID=1631249 RepID=A0A1R3V213_9HYPH|nr:hypothetical protein BQ8794_140044 [Mesorhizobium prunaredense]
MLPENRDSSFWTQDSDRHRYDNRSGWWRKRAVSLVLQVAVDLSYSPSTVFLHLGRLRGVGRRRRDGFAELLDHGSIEITFASQWRRGHPPGQT